MKLSSRFFGLNRYQKTAIITVIFTFVLIFIGGLVRASGAGLGCPDWPRCFGQWIPPLTASGLPAGFDPAEFNVFKTWMEYANRLVGVLIGFLITLTFIFSFSYYRQKPVVFYSSAAAFLLVLFQGWLGGQVVRSGLSEWVITIHMLVALIIVNVLMFAAFKSMSGKIQLKLTAQSKNTLLIVAGLLLLATLAQVAFGTQVREAIDAANRSNPFLDRALWIYEVGWIDQLHRTFSWVVLILSASLIYFHQRAGITGLPYKLSFIVMALVLSQFIIGIVLAYLGMPPAFQVLHLWGASVLVGAEFLYILIVNESRKVPIHELHGINPEVK